MDPTQGAATATELGTPRPLPMPQTGELTPQDGAEALAQPTLGPQIAQQFDRGAMRSAYLALFEQLVSR